jgi:hypothetical protein
MISRRIDELRDSPVAAQTGFTNCHSEPKPPTHSSATLAGGRLNH